MERVGQREALWRWWPLIRQDRRAGTDRTGGELGGTERAGPHRQKAEHEHRCETE